MLGADVRSREGAMSFWEIIKEHIGHDIQAVVYGRYYNAIECHECH